MQKLGHLAFLYVTVAITLFTTAVGNAQQATENRDALAEQGQQALAAGRLDTAESSFAELAKLEPTVAEVHATLGAIYYQEGNLDQAIASLRRALHLKASLTKSKALLAICLSERGDTAEALPGLEAGFHSTLDAQAKRMCGLQLLRAYSALHRDADAAATALAMNKLYPDDAEILYQTGRIFGNYTYLTMERLRDKAPDSVWTIQAAAEAQESEKQYEQSLESYARVLQLEPQRPGVHYRMGRVYLDRFEQLHEEKDRAAAATEFGEELRIDPENGNAAYELAQIERDTGKLDQAELEFESLVKRRPEFEQARVGLAGVLLDSDKSDLAITELRRAVELDPQDEVAWYRLAMALRMKGDADGNKKAMGEYRRLHAIESGRLARAGILTQAGEITPQQIGNSKEP